MADVFVGIDLGTTTTLIAKATEIDGRLFVKVLDIPQKDRDNEQVDMKYLPSVAYFPDKTPPIVGLEAQIAGQQDTTRFVRAVKRQMGRRIVIPQAGELPYTISSLYLQKALDAANYQAVGDFIFTVTVPASFTSNQRADTLMALQLACEKVGLELPKKDPGQIFISEPVAAMLAFIHQQLERMPERRQLNFDKINWVVVYDIGGGTCDLTLVFIEPKKTPVSSIADLNIEVDAISYYNPFGGEDFDNLVAQELHRRLMESIPDLKSVELTDAERTSVRLQLMNVAKKLKEKLSAQAEEMGGKETKSIFDEEDEDEDEDEENSCPYRENIRIKNKEYNLAGKMTWEEFISAVQPLLSGPSRKSLITPLANLLDKTKRECSKLDGLLIVGGMGKLPLVKEKLEEFWGSDKIWLYKPSDHAVVTGAAIYSYLRKYYPGFRLKEDAADSYYVRTIEGFDMILPSRGRQGEPKEYKLKNDSDKLILQIFAGEEPEVNKPVESIYHTLIHQGGTVIDLKKTYKKNTPVWIQMGYDSEGEGEDHTKVPWVYVWIGNSPESTPTARLRYTDLIRQAHEEERHVQSI